MPRVGVGQGEVRIELITEVHTQEAAQGGEQILESGGAYQDPRSCRMGSHHDGRRDTGSNPSLWGPDDGMKIHPLFGLCPSACS